MNRTRTRLESIRLASLLILGLFTAASAHATKIRLAWNPSPEAEITGYRLYAGTSAGSYTTSLDVGLVTEAEMAAPPDVTRLFFAVSAYTSVGIESSLSDVLTVDLGATAENRPPEISVNSISTDEDTPTEVNISVWDPDEGLAIITSSSISATTTTSVLRQPSNGRLDGSAPNYIYTPNLNFSGTDSFDLQATDGLTNSPVTTVSIQVRPVDDPPVALAGSRTVNEEGLVSFVLSGTDVEGSPVTYALATPPAHGTLTGTPPSLSYRANLDFVGTDTFTFTVNDGVNTSVPGDFSIVVTQVNDTPVATPASYSFAEDTAFPITLAAVDVDGDALTYTISTAPTAGTLSGTPPTLIYRPNTNYAGADSFRFMVSDGKVSSTSAAVQLTITPVNDAPSSAAASLAVVEDIARSLVLFGSDPDGQAITFTIAQAPANGTLSGTAPNLTYTPKANYNGTDSFRYFVSDASGLRSPTNTISVAISAVNDAPTPNPITITIPEDTAGAITLTAVDPDHSTITYVVTQAPLNGTLSGTPPNLTYRPRTNYFGSDIFKFTATDGTATSSAVNVSITIPAVNDVPVAVASARSVNEEGLVSFVLSGTDVEGSSLTYKVTRAPAKGTLTGTPPSLSYRGATNFFGTDTFEFTVNDGTATSAPATFTLTVIPVNDRPVALPQTVTVTKNKAKAITLTAADADGDPLWYSISGSPTYGTLSGSPPNVTYTPKVGYVGADSFRFTATDGSLTSLSGTVTINVSATSGSTLTVGSSSLQVIEDNSTNFTLVASDSSGRALTYTLTTTPTNGTLSGTAPNLVYRPNTNAFGSDLLRFSVSNGLTNGTGSVQFTINAVNDAPTASANSITLAEDTSASITLTGADVEGSPLTYVISQAPANGVLTGTPPALVYTPGANFSGTDSFRFTVSDGALTSASALVSLTVSPVNDAPIATSTSLTVAEDGSIAITLGGSDLEGSPLVFAITQAPANGTLSGTAPNLVYTPGANFNGSDVLRFTVSDGSLVSGVATVSIAVTPVNDAPVAQAASVTIRGRTPTPLVLAGSDVEGSPLTFAVTQAPANGTLSGTPPNLTYTAQTGFAGQDTIHFTTSDGSLTSAAATVTITVINRAPLAVAASVSLNEDSPAEVALSGTDEDGDSLTYTVLDGPAHGALSGTPPNLTYTPGTNYFGSDSLRFTVSDGASISEPATITLAIAAVNDAPTATPATYTVDEDGSVSITLGGSDPEGSTLGFTVSDLPLNGRLIGSAPNLTYRPNTNYSGPDSFTFTVWDGDRTSVAATIALDVTPVNDIPVANPGTLTAETGKTSALVLTGSDLESTAVSFMVIQGPTNGTLSGRAPNLYYTPGAGYVGADSLRFKVTDGTDSSEPATIAITVTTLNRAPVAVASSRTLNEDTPVAVTLSGTDPDGDSLTYTVTVPPANGTLSGTLPNLIYRPATNYFGTDSFQFTVSDGSLVSAPATVSLTISPVNDVPVPLPASYTVAEDGSISIKLVGVDPEGSWIGYVVPQLPRNGRLVGAAPNLTYKPNPNYAGPDSFTFTVWDGQRTSGQATISLTVTPVNDAPLATPAAVTVFVGIPTEITTTGTDVDGDSLTYTLVQAPAKGTLTGTLPNVTYVPQAGYQGSDSFRFTVSDGTLVSAAATVSLTVKHGIAVQPDALVVLPGGTASTLVTGATSILTNDTASDGSKLTAKLTSVPTNGVIMVSTDGTFLYSHNGGTNLSETVAYTASSTSGLTNTAGAFTVHIFRILGGDVTPEGTELEFSIVKGLQYTIETLDSTPTTESVWSTLATFTGDVTGVASMLDSDPDTDSAQYYRVRCTFPGTELVSEPWLRVGATVEP